MRGRISFSINLVLIIVVIMLLSSGFSAGANFEAGSATDPLVTQSYVEARINALNASLDERLNNLDVSSDGSQVAFEVFEVKKDQVVMLEENSLFILRAGEVVAVIDAGAGGGISDLTTGFDIVNGETIVKNHLLLTPRTDGRGVSFKSDGWVMISGGFKVQ